LLIVMNVLLLISGLAMMFGGTLLIYNYHMTRLYFLSKWLYAFPVSTITIGMFLLLVSIFGIIVALSEKKVLLIIYSALVFAMVFPIFYNQFAAIRLEQDTDEKAFTNNQFVKRFKDHILGALRLQDEQRERLMDEWYYIQSDLKCCGDGRHGDANGINFWQQNANFDDLPPSCCVKTLGEPVSGCQYKDFYKFRSRTSMDDRIDAPVYRIGCLSVLDHLFYSEVLPILDPFYIWASNIIVVLLFVAGQLAVANILLLAKK